MSGNARSDGRALGVARQPIVGDRLPRRGIRSKLPEFRSNSWINRRPHPTAPRSWRDPWGSRVKPRCGSTGQCTDVAHCARHELPGEAAICHTPASCARRASHHPGPSLAFGTNRERAAGHWPRYCLRLRSSWSGSQGLSICSTRQTWFGTRSTALADSRQAAACSRLAWELQSTAGRSSHLSRLKRRHLLQAPAIGESEACRHGQKETCFHQSWCHRRGDGHPRASKTATGSR
jgi:hypothetical protein